ncbi:MAG: hypothetical protein RLZZ01_2556 [Actinomycetota bacterium]
MILAHSVHGSLRGVGVVLLHSLALDRSVWDDVIERLGELPVVAVDLRGHGASPGNGPVDIEDMAGDVVETVEHLGLTRILLVGLSLGGCVAQAVAGAAPHLVGHLVLADTTAWYGDGAAEAWAERATTARTKGFDALAGFQLDRWFGDRFLTEHRPRAERLLDIFRSNRIDDYAATCEAMGRFDFRSRLGDVTASTDVVVGELDPATPVAHSELIASLIPDARLVVLAGARHLSAVECPDEIAEIVRRGWQSVDIG